MKKILFILAAVASFAVQADFLYWMIDTTSAGAFNYNTVILTDEGGTLQYQVGPTVANADIATMAASGGYFTSGGESTTFGAGTSFFVELYNGSTSLAKSETKALAQLAGAVHTGGISTGIEAPAVFGSFTATSDIPEPTSGMLILIGGMLLGLKRRRMV